MPRKVEKSAVVDDKTIRVLPDNRGLHAVVENLARHTAAFSERDAAIIRGSEGLNGGRAKAACTGIES